MRVLPLSEALTTLLYNDNRPLQHVYGSVMKQEPPSGCGLVVVGYA